MGYLSIQNLYKDQTILMFKEAWSLEKCHGTSSHISWNYKQKSIRYFSGGEKYTKFLNLFDQEHIKWKFQELFLDTNVTIFGEAYGGKQQGMSDTYGSNLRFIAFDVKVNDMWMDVPNADRICKNFNIDFVPYRKITTDIEIVNAERDRDSEIAVINGCGSGKMREGVILRPLMEMVLANGERVICKHKRNEFMETKTPREVNTKDFEILTNAIAIADEWVVDMRLSHVLQKLPKNIGVESTKMVIDAMVADVYKEAKGEIIESKEVIKAIGDKTAKLFIKKLKNRNYE